MLVLVPVILRFLLLLLSAGRKGLAIAAEPSTLLGSTMYGIIILSVYAQSSHRAKIARLSATPMFPCG